MVSQDKNFLTVPLDSDILLTPFDTQTRWQVITGAPCSGKSTLIDLLAAQGFQTVPEVGRRYIENEIARGRTLAEIRASEVAFAAVLQWLTLMTERALQAEDILFLDRAFPDS